MESQGDLPYYTGIINRDIDIESSLLGTSQNNPISISDSPPQVENASSALNPPEGDFRGVTVHL